jgi:hypothetical protein
LDCSPNYLFADVLKIEGGKIKVVFLLRNTTALIQPVGQSHPSFKPAKATYCSGLLGGVINSEFQITEPLKTLMLMDVAHSVDSVRLALGKIITTMANYWKR